MEELEISIQEKEVHVLKSKFSKITNSKIYKNKFKKRFIDDGCFLKANVIDTNGNYQDVLCFSGLKQFDGSDYLSIAINDIVNSGVFHNPYLVKVNDNIRYYITHDKYITLGDAKTNSKTLNPRMFSCCERKTFADYDWSKCRSYKMTIKYEPCALCEISVKKHSDKYNGTIICGKSESLKPIDKAKYDSIAQVIYDSVHKT